jgi:hypothetical protein
MERELNIQSSTQPKQPLSYNEWSQKFGVSTKYIEPTKYFQGNPSSGFVPLEEREDYSFIGRVGQRIREILFN